jgi:hypothetical protein
MDLAPPSWFRREVAAVTNATIADLERMGSVSKPSMPDAGGGQLRRRMPPRTSFRASPDGRWRGYQSIPLDPISSGPRHANLPARSSHAPFPQSAVPLFVGRAKAIAIPMPGLRLAVFADRCRAVQVRRFGTLWSMTKSANTPNAHKQACCRPQSALAN